VTNQEAGTHVKGNDDPDVLGSEKEPELPGKLRTMLSGKLMMYDIGIQRSLQKMIVNQGARDEVHFTPIQGKLVGDPAHTYSASAPVTTPMFAQQAKKGYPFLRHWWDNGIRAHIRAL
jgi:hypothetical protein